LRYRRGKSLPRGLVVLSALAVATLVLTYATTGADAVFARVAKIVDGDTLHVVLQDDAYRVCRLGFSEGLLS